MATEAERKKAEKQADRDRKQRFKEWKALQEKAGYTVEGDSFQNARIVELEDGPTYDERVG